MAFENKTHRKFVEIGRVAYAAKGPKKGKLFAIIDVIDYNRVLVDGPEQGSRREEKLSNLSLTKYKIKIQHGQSTKLVKKAWQEGQITQKWEKSDWAKKFARREKLKSLSDFDRFKVAHLKKAKNRQVERVRKIQYKRKVLLRENRPFKLLKKKPLETKPKKLKGKQLKKPKEPKDKKTIKPKETKPKETKSKEAKPKQAKPKQAKDTKLKKSLVIKGTTSKKPMPIVLSRLFARLRTKGALKENDEKAKKGRKERREKALKEKMALKKAAAEEAAKKRELKKASAKKRDPKKRAPSKKQDPKKKQAAKPVKKSSDSKSEKKTAE